MAGLNALQYTYALVPLFTLTCSAPLICFFPITRERREELRRSIAAEKLRLRGSALRSDPGAAA
jgi:Na+/melibiose symporter-like transporter